MKINVGVTIDKDVYALLDDYPNKSVAVNNAIRLAYQTERGLQNQLEMLELELKTLKEKYAKYQAQEQRLVIAIPAELKIELAKIRRILATDPDKFEIWNMLVNKKYNTYYTPTQFKRILEGAK